MVATGDGSVKLFDIGLDEFPIRSWKEHNREVFAVHWNLVAKDTFCSSSWDGTIKVVRTPSSILLRVSTNQLPPQWSPERDTSLLTLPTHTCTYSASFSPHHPALLSAVSSDSHLRLFDLRTPPSASNHLVLTIPLHAARSAPSNPTSFNVNTPSGPFAPNEALTHDWNKYRSNLVAAAGVDRLIRTFDIRSGGGPLEILGGHDYAVRRVAWSPHLSDTLLSASYDMTCRVWTDGSAKAVPEEGGARELGRMGVHTEFVCGVDWCLFGAEGWAASTGWDERVCVWDVREFMRP